MKKLLTLALTISALSGIVSCGGDDESTPKFKIDETILNDKIVNAYVIDEGYCCSQFRTSGSSDQHQMVFVLTDGEFTFGTDGYIDDFNDGEDNIYIEITAHSEGQSLAEGEFNFDDYCNENGIYNFIGMYGRVGDNTDYRTVEGTATITSSGSTKYKMVFDGELHNFAGAGRLEGDFCSSMERYEISGEFSATFQEISIEVWND